MKTLTALQLVMLFCSATAKAQTAPARGDHELELWTAGGHSVGGGIGGISAWNVGLRYGWILTGPHGPGFLRGQFEYAVDVVPVFWVFQPKGTAYGFALDPIALKWDLRSHSRVVPYLEVSGGMLFTSRNVPPGISWVNFASGGGAGVYFLGKKHAWSAELRFTHISDAGLTTPNPGVNTIQVRLGFSAFRHRE